MSSQVASLTSFLKKSKMNKLSKSIMTEKLEVEKSTKKI